MATIAVVDDNEDCCRLLERLLRDVGHIAICMCTGRNAINVLVEMKPDLLLLDLMMPEINGIDLLRQLRAEPSLQNLPVVIYSAVIDVTVQTSAIQLGANDFVVKGLDWRMLLDRIEQYLPKTASSTVL